MNLISQVREYIRRHDLLTVGDGVVVGVSGGPDSLCMLHLLVALQTEYRLSLYVAHLHHGARGEDADEDAAFVAQVARQHQLPATIARRDVPGIAEAHKLAFEEAARRVRYAFLARVAVEAGANRIAVGHNADDQAETVLMHFLRGAGPAGLRGMLPATPLSSYRTLESLAEFELPAAQLSLIRPMLGTPRAEIERYCEDNDLQPRFDRSNLDTTFFRNRLRHELLPILETYNPQIKKRLNHTAQLIGADYARLEYLRDWAWGEIVLEESESCVVMDLVSWRAQALSTQRALIREAAYRLRPQLRDVSFVHVENAVRIGLEGTTGSRATLPNRLEVVLGYDRLIVAHEGYDQPLDGPSLETGEEIAVAMPGTTPVGTGGWSVEATLLEDWSLEKLKANPERWTAYMDAALVAQPLVLRSRRTGDRFRPQGMAGHAPALNEWMTNAKVPREWRAQLPLLLSDEEIVWVCGWRVSESVVVGPSTQQVVRFRLLRNVDQDQE